MLTQAEALERDAKRRRVDNAELASMQVLLPAAHHPPCCSCMAQVQGKQDGTKKAGGGGMFRGLIDTIIGNLQLSIGNVHVRYEVRPSAAHLHHLAHASKSACCSLSWHDAAGSVKRVCVQPWRRTAPAILARSLRWG